MTREQKLAMILGFALVLVVGVLVSDHLSKAGRDDSLTTDGLDGGYAAQDGRSVNTQLLVNPDAIPEQINATPERRFARGGDSTFLGGAVEGARSMTNLPEAVVLTKPTADEVPEFSMGTESIPDEDRPTPARLYRVMPDDSLWSIAEGEYGDGTLYAKLAEYNHDRVGDGGTIREGATILIPSREALLAYERGDERDVRRGTAPPRSEPARSRDLEPARTRTYTVQRGETLSEIAKDELGSALRWREVVELNDGDIPENGAVRVGQEIKLPKD